MSNSSIPVGGTDKLLQTYENTIGSALVQSEAVTPTDSSGAPFTASNRFPVTTDGLTQAQLNSAGLSSQLTSAAILAKLIAAPATEAKQDTGNTSLATIAAKDFATQATLASVLAKIIAAPSTEAKQDTGNTTLVQILAAIQALSLAVAVPTLMTKNLSIPANQQANAGHRIVCTAPFKIKIGTGAVLVRA